MDTSEADIISDPHEEDIEDKSQTLFLLDVDAVQDCQDLNESSAEKNAAEIIGQQMCLRPDVYSAEEDGTSIFGDHGFQSSKGFSFDKTVTGIDGNCECLSPKETFVNKHGTDTDGEQKDQISEVFFLDKRGMDINCKLEYKNPDIQSVERSGSCHSVKDEADIYVVPELSMEFESEEDAYMCYNRYAALEGFSIRKDFVNKSRIDGLVVSRRYTCHKQGNRPTKRDAKVKKPRKDTRSGCLAHLTIARQPSGKYRVTHFETKHNHELATPITAHLLPSQRRITFAEAVEAELANNSVMDGVPKLGMGFVSEDHAYEYYNAYAGRVGFSVRKDYVNRSKIDGAVASRRFTCFREGFRQRDKRDLNVKRPRKETRIGCLAQLVIARQPDGKYRVTHFEENHNHELVPTCRVRMLRSQKRSSQEASDVINSNTLSISAPELICKPSMDEGNCGYHPINCRSKLLCRRMREMRQGEAESILQYFQKKQLKDSSFFYAVQVDAEDEITNVFWADAKMLVDYGDFGDVVCFDSTYRLKKCCRPFAPFVGVNHHKQLVIFGAALLYDETVESFEWLFRTFIETMSGKKPKTTLTDKDAIISEAINLVIPETHQQLCVWHVYQNALIHLSEVIVGSESFANDLGSCMFHPAGEEDFINAWKAMLDTYGLWENVWLDEIFKEREKWAIPYRRDIFCAGMMSAQLSESFTTSLRKYLESDLDVLQFFKQFGKVVNDWRYRELEANYDMSQRMPRLMGDAILLKQARDGYTPIIFELFQQEYESSLNAVANQCTDRGSLFEYKVSIYGQLREYVVKFNSAEDSVVCNCMKFQSIGVLCSHALKVLDYRNIKVIPTQYILKRWTKDARC